MSCRPIFGVKDVTATFLADTRSHAEIFDCTVVEEDALVIEVEDIGRYSLMWTPTGETGVPMGFLPDDGVIGEIERPEALALAFGFAHSEGTLRSLDDLHRVAACEAVPGAIRMQLKQPDEVNGLRRNVVINSSCGICGPVEMVEDNVLGLNPVPDTVKIEHAAIQELMSAMQERQAIFSATGGSHAAAIFNPSGELVSMAEDLGRHNALDKAIGMGMLRRGDVRGCVAVLSSRLSLEMVVKAVRAGLEVVLAVSAPTSLAVQIADRFNITLGGFVRDERATVFSHPHRIISGTA